MGAEPREPFPKQKRFLLHTETPEVSYGGAAGGAKSVALLFGASQYLHVPGYAALLLRASFPDLMQPNALIPLSKEWWLNRPDATWSVQERRWTFACSGGGTSTITFGYLERDDDVYQYQGAAYQFIGIDELTQHTEFRYGEPTYVKPVGLLQCGHGYMAVENGSRRTGMGLRPLTQPLREPAPITCSFAAHLGRPSTQLAARSTDPARERPGPRAGWSFPELSKTFGRRQGSAVASPPTLSAAER